MLGSSRSRRLPKVGDDQAGNLISFVFILSCLKGSFSDRDDLITDRHLFDLALRTHIHVPSSFSRNQSVRKLKSLTPLLTIKTTGISLSPQ